MYFTTLPDHSKPGFDEQLHFSKFKKHNIIFNTLSNSGYCDKHVGCLSFKTVLTGEEWYGINNNRLAIRPGQFLVLNDEQTYSCNIAGGEKVRSFSVFFKNEFAASVLQDTLINEGGQLDNYALMNSTVPEFFQTLTNFDQELQQHLSGLIASLENFGYEAAMMDEYLVFLLRYLLRVHNKDRRRSNHVQAIKSSTKTELYKRLCVAKDILHSSFMENPGLDFISASACLSVPQLVRQFKAVFHVTPYQYLIHLKLEHAARLLKHTNNPIHSITWMCGFEDTSAFCRAFKSQYGVSPVGFRRQI